jgi:hypothetical protein
MSDRDRAPSPAPLPVLSPHSLSSSPLKLNLNAVDESLAIDMSQNGLESFQSSPADVGPSRHPTARTIACDMETDVFSRSRKRRQDRRPAKSSKYFQQPLSEDDEWDVFRSDPETKGESDTDVLVAGSSSPVPPAARLSSTAPTAPPKRTNPFLNTKEESDRRKILKPAPKDDSIVDMTKDTPERQQDRVPLKSIRNAQISRALVASNSSMAKHISAVGQTSIVDFVGLRDQHGRPKKGVVAGAKVKRRA